MILSIVFVGALCFYISYYLKRRRMYQLASLIPGTTAELPLLGLAHNLRGASSEDFINYLQYLSYKSMKHDGLIKTWLGSKLYFISVHPLDVEEILKTSLEKVDFYRFIRKLLGRSTVFAPVQFWKQRRKVLAPALGPRVVDKFIDTFATKSENLVEELSVKISTEEFDIWPFIVRYTFDSICENALGINVNAQKSSNIQFLTAFNDLMFLVNERIFRLWLRPDWLYQFFPQYHRHEECIKTIHDFTDQVIQNRRKEIGEVIGNQTHLKNDEFLETYKNKSFLDLLISSSSSDGKKGYNDCELREEVLGLISAGTDTTAVAIANTILLLGKYPHIQEKVYKELQDVFHDSDRRPEKADLIKLEYLERVIKESTRLLPSAPFIGRQIQKEITLPSGRTLPAGSGALISIWGLNRDRKYWGPDGNNFDPDRFLPERYNIKYSCSFLPFSHGPRNCLGYKYAHLSMKVALSTILRRYKVVATPEPTPIPRIRVKLDIMMKVADGYKVSIQRR